MCAVNFASCQWYNNIINHAKSCLCQLLQFYQTANCRFIKVQGNGTDTKCGFISRGNYEGGYLPIVPSCGKNSCYFSLSLYQGLSNTVCTIVIINLANYIFLFLNLPPTRCRFKTLLYINISNLILKLQLDKTSVRLQLTLFTVYLFFSHWGVGEPLSFQVTSKLGLLLLK